MQTIIVNKSRKFGKEILSFSRNYTFRRENFFSAPCTVTACSTVALPTSDGQIPSRISHVRFQILRHKFLKLSKSQIFSSQILNLT